MNLLGGLFRLVILLRSSSAAAILVDLGFYALRQLKELEQRGLRTGGDDAAFMDDPTAAASAVGAPAPAAR